MEYAISIKLTEKQFYVLDRLAKREYRTIGNTLGMLIATGFGYFLQERDIYIVKLDQDMGEGDHKHTGYTDAELENIVDGIPLIQ